MEVYNRADVHNFYNLEFKKLKVNIFTGNVHIGDVHFVPRKKDNAAWFAKHGSVRLDVERITVTGADIISFIQNDLIDVGKFKIKNATLFADNSGDSFMPFAFIRKKNTTDSTGMKIRVGEIRFSHTKFIYLDKKNSEKENHLDDFNLVVRDLQLNKTGKDFSFDVGKFLVTDSIVFPITDPLPSLIYRIFLLW